MNFIPQLFDIAHLLLGVLFLEDPVEAGNYMTVYLFPVKTRLAAEMKRLGHAYMISPQSRMGAQFGIAWRQHWSTISEVLQLF